MPTYICSFVRDGERYYFDFSTVVDAPTTCAMKRVEYENYYSARYGAEGAKELPARLRRANKKGTSSEFDKSLHDTVRFNRAGPREGRLSIGKLLDLVWIERRNWIARCAEEGGARPVKPTI